MLCSFPPKYFPVKVCLINLHHSILHLSTSLQDICPSCSIAPHQSSSPLFHWHHLLWLHPVDDPSTTLILFSWTSQLWLLLLFALLKPFTSSLRSVPYLKSWIPIFLSCPATVHYCRPSISVTLISSSSFLLFFHIPLTS